MPLHFHTVGGRMPDGIRKTLWGSAWGEKVDAPMDFRVARAGFAVHISGFQIYMSTILMSMIYGGVLERHPRMRMIIGEGGIGWIPYILDHMDLEWEDQFGDLGLSMKPSEYWRRQCYGHVPVRSHRHQDDRRAGRGQRDVGLRLPASRRRLAGLDRGASQRSSVTCPRACGTRSSAATPAASTASSPAGR